MLDRNVAERLRRLEIPASSFAGVIGLHHAALSLYLNQRANPSAATEEKIMSTLKELERLSKLLPYLPNFRSVIRVQALLLAFRAGEFEPYARIATEQTAVAEHDPRPIQPTIPRPVDRPGSDPTGYQTRT